MNAIRVFADHFSGVSRVHGRERDGLASILRGLAIDNARLAVAVAAVADFTDSSTGAAQASVPNVLLLTAMTDARTAAVGAQLTAFNAGLAKLDAAFVAFAEGINKARLRLGLELVAYTGAPATSGTIPALDKTVAGAQGNLSASFGTVNRALYAARGNLGTLTRATDEILSALGFPVVVTSLTGRTPDGYLLPVLPPAAASATGADAASAADATAAFLALANGIATLAVAYNARLSQGAQATTPLNVVAA